MSDALPRVVRLDPGLYPPATVRRALDVFHAEVTAREVVRAATDGSTDVTLALHPRPNASPVVVDEVLDAMLRAALEQHLGRPAGEGRLPRGV